MKWEYFAIIFAILLLLIDAGELMKLTSLEHKIQHTEVHK